MRSQLTQVNSKSEQVYLNNWSLENNDRSFVQSISSFKILLCRSLAIYYVKYNCTYVYKYVGQWRNFYKLNENEKCNLPHECLVYQFP